MDDAVCPERRRQLHSEYTSAGHGRYYGTRTTWPLRRNDCQHEQFTRFECPTFPGQASFSKPTPRKKLVSTGLFLVRVHKGSQNRESNIQCRYILILPINREPSARHRTLAHRQWESTYDLRSDQQPGIFESLSGNFLRSEPGQYQRSSTASPGPHCWTGPKCTYTD
jgi:hypothetical protein